MQRLLEERQKQIAEYKEFRRQVEAWRAHDHAIRNQIKIKQLEDAQALQVRGRGRAWGQESVII